MMKKAYEKYGEYSNTKYIYVSRNSLRQSLFYKCRSFQESLQYLTEERYVSYAKLLKYYGFDVKEQIEIALSYGLSLSTEIAFEELHNDRKAMSFFSDYRQIIVMRSTRKANSLRKYLLQEDFIGQCVIVDIGWHGSMQYYLEKFVLNEGIQAEISGLYLGINPQYKTNGKMKGYLYSSNDSDNRKKVLCFLGGYEKLFQSQEGSTKGYIEADDKVFPVVENYEYIEREELIRRIEMWQKGAMDYMKEMHVGINDATLVAPLLRFGTNPPLWGIKMFDGFFINDGGKQLFVSSKPLYRYTPKEFTHALSNSVWKTGFMRSVMKIPLPYYYIYKLIRK